MIDWAQTTLIDDLARRRCVILIGSGVSRHATGKDGAKPPVWKDFLREAAQNCPDQSIDHIRNAIDENDLLHACEWLKKRYDEGWIAFLKRTFQSPKFKPGEIHDVIISIDASIIFSLNFDDIFERAARDGTHTVKHYYDEDFADFLRGDGRYIVKVHGSMNSPNKLIFTQNDYARARVLYSAFYTAFDACLMTNTFLFIGAGINDPDVNLILENQNFQFSASSPHYFLTGSDLSNDLKESLRKNRNLKVISYDPTDENHTGLVEELKILSILVDEKRQYLGSTGIW